MSPAANIAYYALWWAHPLLQAAVAGAMLWRKLHRTFPVFFTYVLAQIAIFAVVFPLSIERWAPYPVFFYTFWATTSISVILGFRVLHEVFLDVFRPYHTLRDLGSMLFKWAGLVMLLVAGVVAASTQADGEPLVQGVLTLQRSMRVVQCGLVIFLLVFSRYLGISWRQKSFGIALGFGGAASVELFLIALAVSHLGTTSDTRGLINMAAYNVAILVWLGYVLVKSPARDAVPANMLRPQRWEQGLNDIQHPHAPDSLIPMFETMVDRALSRTNGDPAGTHQEVPAVRSEDSAAPRSRYPRTPREVSSKS